MKSHVVRIFSQRSLVEERRKGEEREGREV